MRGLGRHLGEISSSSWGKETIRDKVVKSMRRGFDFTKSKEMNNEMQEMIKMKGTNEWKGVKPQAQKNKSVLIQAQKTLVSKDGVLTAAIWRCRLELAKKKGFRDIEASKDAVEVAGRDFMQASSIYCMYVEEDPAESFPDPAEEVRRVWYEWKVLSEMMEEVVKNQE